MSDRVLESCPACAAPDREFVEAAHGFEIVRCTTCGLEYTMNPAVDLNEYAKTYGGEGGLLVNPRPYASPAARLALECDAFFRPAPQLAVAQRWVLEQIEAQIPQDSAVLDLGCGTGRFLAVLSRRSYRGIGIDPAEPVVAALRSLGYAAHVGSVPGLRWDGPAPGCNHPVRGFGAPGRPIGRVEGAPNPFPRRTCGRFRSVPVQSGPETGPGTDRLPTQTTFSAGPHPPCSARSSAPVTGDRGCDPSSRRKRTPGRSGSPAAALRSPPVGPLATPRSRAAPALAGDHPPCSEESWRPRRSWRIEPGRVFTTVAGAPGRPPGSPSGIGAVRRWPYGRRHDPGGATLARERVTQRPAGARGPMVPGWLAWKAGRRAVLSLCPSLQAIRLCQPGGLRPALGLAGRPL